jgi:transcriptional regulator with XRE-family HTH domain
MLSSTNKKIHEGYNLKRIREILQVKQSVLAGMLGSDWTQKKISQLEDKEVIDPDILIEVAAALKVTPEAIREFDDEAAVNIIASNHNGRDHSAAVNYQCTFNPVDKIVELYEALVKSEREKVAMLEKQYAGK